MWLYYNQPTLHLLLLHYEFIKGVGMRREMERTCEYCARCNQYEMNDWDCINPESNKYLEYVNDEDCCEFYEPIES